MRAPAFERGATQLAGPHRPTSGSTGIGPKPVSECNERVKPFSFAELLARLRALSRRGPVDRPTVLAVGDLRLDPATRQVWRGATEIELSAKEFALLETFMRRPGEVLSRFQLLEHAWDYEYENRSNVVDVYVRYLREKIDRPFGVESIETSRGAGYRLREDGAGVASS